MEDGRIEKYSIGDTAKLSGVTIPTLRYYDKIGLLKPDQVDQSNLYRYYSQDNLKNLMCIKQLRKLDFSLEEIQDIIQRGDSNALEQKVRIRMQEIREEQSKLKTKYEAAKKLQTLLKEGNSIVLDSDIEEKEYPDGYVISIKKQGKCETNNYILWYGELLRIAETYQLHITGELSIKYFSQLYKLNRNDACVEVSATVLEKKSECPYFHLERGFTGVKKIYQGPYESINMGYVGLIEYMKEKNYPIPDMFMFRYLLNKAFTQKEEEYCTEIILPIKK